MDQVELGYMGGDVADPSYEQVCSGDTGHAEIVRITFDPSIVSSRELLEVFFSIHDPTTLDRQGNDVGSQYRSAIFYLSPQQQSQAEAFIGELKAQKAFASPIVTELVQAGIFYSAEGYHHSYFENKPQSAVLSVHCVAQGCQVPATVGGPFEGSSLAASQSR